MGFVIIFIDKLYATIFFFRNPVFTTTILFFNFELNLFFNKCAQLDARFKHLKSALFLITLKNSPLHHFDLQSLASSYNTYLKKIIRKKTNVKQRIYWCKWGIMNFDRKTKHPRQQTYAMLKNTFFCNDGSRNFDMGINKNPETR